MRQLLASIVLLCASLVAHAEPVERTWTVEGVERKAMVHTPASAKEKPTPVVFVFHGHGGTMRHAARTMAFHRQWPEAIIVYPQGLNTPGRLSDPEGKRPGWQAAIGDYGDRDLKFFDAMLASLKGECKVDDRRIYATGHSNGGAFTYLVWEARHDVFAAMAPSGAAGRQVAGVKPKPCLHVAGETDPLVQYAWQQRAIANVKRINGCAEAGKPWHSAGDLKGTLYESPKGTPLVTLIHPGGHQFPEKAPELIVKFFKEHAKPAPGESAASK